MLMHFAKLEKILSLKAKPMETSIFKKLFISLTTITLLAGCAAPAVNNEDSSTKDQTAVTPKIITMNEQSLQTAMPQEGDKVATIETDLGTIKFKLFTKEIPEMTKNFEELANSDKYNGTPFHRTVKDFMIQTGDFSNKNGTGGYSYKGPGTNLDDEISPTLKHLYGTVSMANRGPNTNGSQFFIVTARGGTPFLDGGYTIFGQVYEGMDVVEKIQNLQVPGTEKPSQMVNMNKVTVTEYKP